MNAQQERAGDKKMGPKRKKSAFPIRRGLQLLKEEIQQGKKPNHCIRLKGGRQPDWACFPLSPPLGTLPAQSTSTDPHSWPSTLRASGAEEEGGVCEHWPAVPLGKPCVGRCAHLHLHLAVRVPDPDDPHVSRAHEEAGLLLPVHHHPSSWRDTDGHQCHRGSLVWAVAQAAGANP